MSKAKFKVGDKVRILDGSKIERFTGGFVNNMKQYIGRVTTIKQIIKKYCCSDRVGYVMNDIPYIWDERGLELVIERPTWKVAIIPDGNKTIGRLYDGHNLVKEVSTIKSPHDEYSMEEAIKVICERLTEKPEKKEEPPKLYNAKVICIKNDPGNVGHYTVGKIYEVVDGKFVSDKGDVLPSFRMLHDFNDLQSYSMSKWIEVVE